MIVSTSPYGLNSTVPGIQPQAAICSQFPQPHVMLSHQQNWPAVALSYTQSSFLGLVCNVLPPLCPVLRLVGSCLPLRQLSHFLLQEASLDPLGGAQCWPPHPDIGPSLALTWALLVRKWFLLTHHSTRYPESRAGKRGGEGYSAGTVPPTLILVLREPDGLSPQGASPSEGKASGLLISGNSGPLLDTCGHSGGRCRHVAHTVSESHIRPFPQTSRAPAMIRGTCSGF